MSENKISTNAIAFIGLCSEYCTLIQGASATDSQTLVNTAVKLLPRIYIVATDLQETGIEETGYIDNVLEEYQYDQAREQLQAALGENDTFLEVFEQDMKYSDTPIAASLSEGLTDLYQVFYNFIASVKDAPDDVILENCAAVKEDFNNYWSQILCNIMRPLNHIAHSAEL